MGLELSRAVHKDAGRGWAKGIDFVKQNPASSRGSAGKRAVPLTVRGAQEAHRRAGIRVKRARHSPGRAKCRGLPKTVIVTSDTFMSCCKKVKLSAKKTTTTRTCGSEIETRPDRPGLREGEGGEWGRCRLPLC